MVSVSSLWHEHDLNDVAGLDVLLGFARLRLTKPRSVKFERNFRFAFVLREIPRLDAAGFFLQARDDFANPLDRGVISPAQIGSFVQLNVIDHFDRVLQIVEGDQRLDEDEKKSPACRAALF